MRLRFPITQIKTKPDLMFYAADRARLRTTMREAGLQEVRFRFDFEGTKILAMD